MSLISTLVLSKMDIFGFFVIRSFASSQTLVSEKIHPHMWFMMFSVGVLQNI